jgi:predicted ATPase
VVVNFEDAGLLDPSTLALLGRLIERAQTLAILVMITFRTSFDPPWAGYPHVLPIRLERLDRKRSLALIAEIAGARPLPAAIVEQIASQTDGVPLFIEEITRTLLERDTHDVEAVELEVPSSLQDTLMARLDRLARAKPIAQLGAALGRAFTHELLAAVALLDEHELGRALDKLIDAGLIDRRGTPPQATYAFKHALVRDAAYASLLHSHRQRLHARIAETLETQFPHTAAAQPELLANHCAAAGLTDKAIDYWQKAAAQADARLANAEAIADLGRALALLGGRPNGGDHDRRELDLQLALGAQLMVTEGPSAPETGRIYTRASELARRLDDPSPLFAALYGLGVFHFCRAELPQSRAISDEMVRLAEGGSDEAHRLTAHRVLAADVFMLGDFRQARRELLQALALYDPARHGELRRVYAYDSRVVSAMYLAWTDFMLGNAAAAFAGCRASLAEARALEHPHTLAFALDAACVLHQWAGEHGTAKKQAAALLVLAERHDYAYWLAQAKMYRGWTLAASGGVAAGIAKLNEGIAAHEATGGAIFVPYHLARLAQAHLAAGAIDAARSALSDALARVERSSERWIEAELHRLTGLTLLADHRPAEAEACFRRALAVAERQEARFWALSAATSLARLLCDEGRSAEGGALLAPVVGWFAEDAPLPELCAARQLLAAAG